jgi:hypothetical protein
VYYFDENGNQKEQRVEKESSVRVTPALPVAFGQSIRLEGIELASANVQRGDAVLLLLYWRALVPIADDYTVVVSLIDANGKRVAAYEKEPRRGSAPTSAWQAGQLIVDAIQLPVPADLAPGAYRLEIALVDAAKQQRIDMIDSMDEQVSIEPVNVLK